MHTVCQALRLRGASGNDLKWFQLTCFGEYSAMSIKSLNYFMSDISKKSAIKSYSDVFNVISPYLRVLVDTCMFLMLA